MTTDEVRSMHGLLVDIGAEVATTRAENREAHKGIDRRLDKLENNHDLVLDQWREHGERLASLPCERHARRISQALQRLGAAEVTGQVQIAEREALRRFLQSAGRVALGVFSGIGVAVAVAGLLLKLGVF
jgi:phenylpropionate dioxygenase-like ring-hydroxylating dioxygenase large terminal subunit